MLDKLTKLNINKSLKPSLEFSRSEVQIPEINSCEIETYLDDYFSTIPSYEKEVWEKVMLNLVSLAYTKKSHDKMASNFGYTSLDKHDFQNQALIFEALSKDNRFDRELAQFIGFMAGTNFFNSYDLSLEDWLISKYWSRPNTQGIYPEFAEKYTIEEILKHKNGKNYLKYRLPRLNHWSRK